MICEKTLYLTRERLLALEVLSRHQGEPETTMAIAENRRAAIRELLEEVLRLGEELESMKTYFSNMNAEMAESPDQGHSNLARAAFAGVRPSRRGYAVRGAFVVSATVPGYSVAYQD